MKLLTLILLFAMLLSYYSFAQQSACDYKVEILIDGKEFEKEDFKWKMRATKIEGKSTNITGTAEIKANGKTVKSYKPWTSDSISKQKTSSEYSPNLKAGEYAITAEITVECDDTNKDDNVDTKTITIKGEKEETTKKSTSKDTAATNKEIQNEEQIPQSSETKSKKPATNGEVDNVIQLTQKNNQQKTSKKQIENQELQVTTYAVKNSQLVYESSNEKAKNLIMIFLLTLSILLNIILIWKR